MTGQGNNGAIRGKPLPFTYGIRGILRKPDIYPRPHPFEKLCYTGKPT